MKDELEQYAILLHNWYQIGTHEFDKRNIKKLHGSYAEQSESKKKVDRFVAKKFIQELEIGINEVLIKAQKKIHKILFHKDCKGMTKEEYTTLKAGISLSITILEKLKIK